MNPVRKYSALAVVTLALFGVAALLASAKADNVMEKVETVKVDVQKLSTGYRVSKLIGSNVVDDANDAIGKVDDLIVSPDDNKSAYVILSVGGWLGMGSHLVALPYDTLRVTATKIVLPDATKDVLKAQPEFKYSAM